MEKPAATRHDILPCLKNRWSPRSFADKPVEQDKLNRIFEAMRWAASSFNEQPWRVLLATRQHPEQFDKLLGCLVEKNQAWARYAPVLGVTLSKKTFSRGGKPNRVHVHDVGLAMGNVCAQATEEGLFVHQMAGVNLDAVVEAYGVPEDFEPVAGFVIGYGDDPEKLPEDWMRDAEQGQRTRADFQSFIFSDAFGTPTDLVQD